MTFGTKKKKKVIEFFDYVEHKLITTEPETEPILLIKNQINKDRELIDNNEWGIAFENLATEGTYYLYALGQKTHRPTTPLPHPRLPLYTYLP